MSNWKTTMRKGNKTPALSNKKEGKKEMKERNKERRKKLINKYERLNISMKIIYERLTS